MPKIIFIGHDGTEYPVNAELNESAMSAAIKASVPSILADCGGSASCGTCHGYVDEAWQGRLPTPASFEQDMLECVLEPQPNSRLTCQLTVTADLDGLVIRLPESQI